ncbi:MAG: hypothetical protein AB1505_18575 [Candidatus Latescibacterota bacterium]
MSRLADIAHVALLVLVTAGVALLIVSHHRYWKGVEQRAAAELLAEKNAMLEDALAFAPQDSTPSFRRAVVKHRRDGGLPAEVFVRVMVREGRMATFHRGPGETSWSSDDRQEDQVTALRRVKSFLTRLRRKPVILGE